MTKQLLPWEEQLPPTHRKGTDFFTKISNLFREEFCYLNPDLRVEQICLRLNTNRTSLIKALKNKGFRSFPHFVNHHRVEAVKTMMAQEKFAMYTLEAIAEMAGFGTRQAFYNTFERLTGMKPAFYRRTRGIGTLKAPASTIK